MGFLLGLLGFGKMILAFILEVVKGIFKFAIEKPFQFLTIVFAMALVWCGWYSVQTKHELVATQNVVREKVKFIEGQDKILKQYVTALKVEKVNHVTDIRRGNDALAGIKKTADKALASAQAKGREVAAKKAQYDNLAVKYANANTSAGTAEERITREQNTTDEFIADMKEAKK